MKRLGCLLLISLVALLSGCANTLKMPLKEDSEQLSATGKPVYLMSVTLRNGYKERFVPWLDVVQVARDGTGPKQDVINFGMDSKGTHEFEDDKQPMKYLVRLELEAGKYTVRGFSGHGRAFPINFTFFAPLHSPLVSGSPGVYYIGAVKATVRERQGNEFKAGSVIPLIDQAVAGISTGTFDVEVSDAFDEDMALFRAKFPALKTASVQKAVLPPFDRAKAQRWWEEN